MKRRTVKAAQHAAKQASMRNGERPVAKDSRYALKHPKGTTSEKAAPPTCPTCELEPPRPGQRCMTCGAVAREVRPC